MSTDRRWFVTGANRGIGAEIVLAALAAGDRVVATCRDPRRRDDRLPGDLDRLAWLTLDVTDAAQAGAAVEEAVHRFGGIDILVNNAGYGQIGFFEQTSPALIEAQFATNLFGAMHVTRAALPTMRAGGGGHILAISSLSGFAGDPGASVYCASKFALEGWMEGLAAELAGFGIRVTLVEPGPFRTDFLDPSSLSLGDVEVAAYAEASAQFRAWIGSENHRQTGDPARLAQALLAIVAADAPPLRFAAGGPALDRLVAKADAMRQDAEAWRTLSLTTETPQP